ncbi:MAG TPA: S26 family signal peptidase [Humisphaera sp.]|jgi:hypothetical protein|nr:S26 family signal peptidase [Humisphaera sp.]
MPDAIAQYLDQVMRHARLAPADARAVRAELDDHLQQLAADRAADIHSPTEMLAMLNQEFGDPKEVGNSIARSKGQLRTWLKKKARRLVIAAAALVMVGLLVRATVAEAFIVGGDGIAPILTRGSRIIVYKLANSYSPQDIIAYQPVDQPGLRLLAIVKQIDPATGDLRVTRNNGVELTVPRTAIVGRVVLSTRHSTP